MHHSIRDTVLGGVGLVIAVLLLAETMRPKYDGIPALNYGFPPSFYPRILLSIWAFLALVVIVRAWFAAPAETARPVLGRLAAAVLTTAVYVWLIGTAGFLLATIPFTGAFMLVLGYRRPVVIAAVTALYPVAVWWLMTGPFKIVLPTSPWFSGF